MGRQSLHIIRVILTLVILSGFKPITAQNLVPNSSFEEYTNCPVTNGLIEWSPPWKGIWGSCDYYHECGTNDFGIPVNRGGGGYARTGQAYGQFIGWSKTFEIREFMEIELIEQLQIGTDYRVEFFLSLQDSVVYAGRNVGAHLSAEPHPQDLGVLLSLEPQVKYQEAAFLDDKLRWMQVSGTFTAQGGEQYLAIGNFDDDAHTDTISVPNGGTLVNHPEGYWDVAGYFIDDVSVIPDSIYLGIEEQENVVSFYPNPATETVTVETGRWQNTGLELFDATGRQVLQHAFGSSREAISVGHLPRGVYVAVLKKDGNLTERRMLVLQ